VRSLKMPMMAMTACILWAMVFPTLKWIYREMKMGEDIGAMMELAGMRFFIAGILILLVSPFFTKKSFFRVRSGDFLKLSTLGIVQTSFLYFFFFIGTSNTTGVKSSVLSQSSIFFVFILAHLIFQDDRLTVKKAGSLLMGLAGIMLINLNQMDQATFLDFHLWGEGFLLLSGFFSALGTILAKKMGRFEHPVLINGWQMTLGGAVLLAFGLYQYDWKWIVFPNMTAVGLFLILILISAGAFTIWYVLLQKEKASAITIYKFSIPMVGSLLSAVFVPGEQITLFILLGIVLVSGGIFYAIRSTSKNKGET
jgi:drug/metabolite transporter (DMT)-like permease